MPLILEKKKIKKIPAPNIAELSVAINLILFLKEVVSLHLLVRQVKKATHTL